MSFVQEASLRLACRKAYLENFLEKKEAELGRLL